MASKNNVHFSSSKYLFCLYLTLACVGLAQNTHAQSAQIKKVVIDAGHGGKDSGTAHGGAKEKDITLTVALKLGKLIKQHHPNVEVIYTRDKDVFVDLDVRAKIANKNHADLFISIHVNGAEDTRATGSETFVMGASKSKANMAVAQRENSVITYEEDYTTKYEGFDPNSPESYIMFSLMQNVYLEQSLHLASFIQEEFGNNPIKVNRGVKQNVFLVLHQTAAPSVLIELGFISNSTDRSILTNDKQQDRMALSVLNAFTRYKNMCEKTGTASYAYESSATEAATNSSATTVSSSDKETVYYRVQIMSINKKESPTSKLFKEHKDVRSIKVGNLYKYTLGNFTKKSEAAALSKRIQKDFPGAFVIAVQDEKIVPAK
ncbi:MAG: N-acetylmuramoyl-L-alanine amidase [Prevotellaceae bacterium]|jgi:N-acetylmuramoyl-L-alanine amidase|nr:N-acetylmuramoyl-L-alanine amidase [Prevotellaceae bacterium]